MADSDVLIELGEELQGELIGETADLWFHSMVLLAHRGLGPAEVLQELERRRGTSGHDEKRSRAEQG